MPSTNPYDAILQPAEIPNPEAVENPYLGVVPSVDPRQQDLRRSLSAAVLNDPDKFAKQLKLAQQAGVTMGSIDVDQPGWEKKINFDSIDFKSLSNTPSLKKWLENYDHASIAHDSLDPLKFAADQIERAKDPEKRGFFGAVAGAGKSGLYDVKKSAYYSAFALGMADPAAAADAIAEAAAEQEKIRASMPESYGDYQRAQQAISDDVNQRMKAAAELDAENAKAALDPSMEGNAVAGELLVGLVRKTWEAITSPKNATIQNVESAASSSPSLVGSAVGGAAGLGGGPAAPVTVPLGIASGSFAGEVPVEFGMWVEQELRRKGVNTADRQQLYAALTNPELTGPIFAEARNKALATSAVDALVAAVGGKLAVGGKGVGGKVAGVAADIGVQAAGGMASEVAGQAAAKGVEGIDWGDVLDEAIGEIGTGAAHTAIGAGLYGVRRTSSEAVALVKDTVAASQGWDAYQAMKTAVDTVKQVPPQKRSPEMVAKLMEEAGGDRSAFFQASEFDKLASSIGQNPAQLAEALTGDANAYTVARAADSEFQVPLGRLLAMAVNAENSDQFLQAARIHDMSASQAKEFAHGAEKRMAQIEQDQAKLTDEVNKLLAEAAVEDQATQDTGAADKAVTTDTFKNAVRKQVEMQLRRSGMDAVEARTSAAWFAAMNATRLERSGLPADQLMAMLPSIIGQGRTDSMDVALDRIRSGALPKDSEVFGKSLVQFLVERGGVREDGGELANMDARLARPGLVNNKGGMVLDEAARVANEAGYISERDINELLNAMRDDLSGSPVYSFGNENADLLALREELLAIEAEVKAAGLDIKTASNEEIKRALDAKAMEGLEQGNVGPRLSAIHNITAENLLASAKLGGLAAPSIAVVPAGRGISGFGDITLIGGKGLGDPATNPVFDADAYTVRFPQPEYGKAKTAPTQKMVNSLKPMAEKYDDRRVIDYFWTYLVNDDTPDRAVSEMLTSSAASATFLKEKGLDVPEPVKRDKPVADMFKDAEFLAWMKAQDWAAYQAKGYDAGDPARREAVAQIEAALKRLNPEMARDMTDAYVSDGEVPFGTMDRLIRDLGNVGKQEVDVYATREAMDKALVGNEAEFKQWVEDKVLPLAGEPKLTVKGRKVPFTLPNIVEYMTAQRGVKGKEKTMTFGEGAARAASAKQFAELEQMREAAKDIVSEEGASRAREEAKKLTESYRNEVIKYYTGKDWRGNIDTWNALDGSMKVVARWAKGGKTDANMVKALRAEGFAGVPPEVVKQAVEAGKAFLRAPVPYFEAKPQRAVSLNEFSAAVVPDDTSDTVRQLLAKNGIEVYDYKEGQRDEVIAKAQAENADTLFQPQGTGSSGGFNPSSNIITLLRARDRSTFFHEVGHWYLETQQAVVDSLRAMDPAAMNDAQRSIMADWEKLLAFLGVDEATWRGMSLDQRRPYHEKMAAATEIYMQEGKAPSKELRSMFARVAGWMAQIYKSAKAIIDRAYRTVPKDKRLAEFGMTDDIRGIFDRILATDEQIAEARSVVDSALPDETPEIQKLREEARIEAEEELRADVMREISAENRKQMMEARKAIEPQVRDEVNAEPAYAAIDTMRGKVEGVAGFKLDLESLRTQYGGSETFDKLKKLRITTSDGGVSARDAAMLLGFKSADDLVMTLANAEDRKVRIKRLTDERIAQRFPTLLADKGAISEAAMSAVHNERRSELLMREIELLSGRVQAATKAGLAPAKDAALRAAQEARRLMKQQATQFIAGRTIRDINPNSYLRAERKAMQAALEAATAGNYEEALRQKRKQLLNSELYRAAMDAVQGAERIRRFMVGVQSEGTQKVLAKAGQVYLDRADTILEGLEFKGVSRTTIERRLRLAKWLDRKVTEAEKLAPPMDEDLVRRLNADARTVNYRDLSWAALQESAASMKSLVRQARMKDKFLKNRKLRELAAARIKITEAIETNVPKLPETKIESERTTWDKWVAKLRSFGASMRMMSSWARQADGGKSGGWVWEFMVRPLNEAADIEVQMRKEAAQRVKEYSDAWAKSGRKMSDSVNIPAIGQSLNLESRIMIALNWGNDGNRDRVMAGHGWDESQVQAILDTLTKEDMDFVQAIWDHINSYWQQIAEKERRVTGVVPDKVEASPVRTSAGRWAGGYFPIIYDPAMSALAGEKDAEATAKLYFLGDASRATTKRNHVQERGAGLGKPLRLSLNVVDAHLAQIIHDLTHHEAIIDMNQVLGDEAIAESIRQHLGPAALGEMRTLIKNVAMSDLVETQADKFFRYLRSGASVATMGFNLGTVAMQVTGVGQSAQLVGKIPFAAAAKRFALNPVKSRELITAASKFMANRETTALREAREVLNRVRGGDWKENVNRWAYYLMLKAQGLVDVVTWMAAYDNAIRDGKDASDATAIADQAVIDTQGSGLMKDMSAVQRGRVSQLFTVYYSYFNVTYNRTAESLASFRRDGGVKSPAAIAHLASDMFLLYTFPAMLVLGLRSLMGTGGGDDDEDFSTALLKEHISAAMGSVVGLRELSGAMVNDYGYRGPAGAMAFDAASKLIINAKQGELDKGLVDAALSTAGIWLHLPVAPVKRLVDGMAYLEDNPQGDFRAVIFGPPKRDK